MLVDSHDVQDAVFAAGIPQRMLAAVDSADIVGLGVLPGPMKMVLGVQHPFLEPSDFVGATFGTVDSALTNATLQALGATPRPLPITAGLDGLDGYEQHAASIVGNHFPETAKYVTANLDLWPRPLVIVINRRRFEQLDHDQQHTLRAAASTAMADAASAARADDANAAQSLCRDGIQLPLATSDQLTALRAAVQSVYDSLRAQPAASADLTEIERIKAQVSASPDQVKCPPTTDVTTAAPPAARLSGTYQWTITPDDARQHGTEGDRQHASDSFPGTFTMDLADGRWTLSQTTGPEVDRGTYQQVQDRVSFDWDLGGRLIFTFSVDDKGVIRLTPVQPMNAGDAFIWSTEPWHPVETVEPSRTGPPPASG